MIDQNSDTTLGLQQEIKTLETQLNELKQWILHPSSVNHSNQQYPSLPPEFSWERVLNIYNQSPEILEPYAHPVQLNLVQLHDSNVVKEPPLFQSHSQGNFWVIPLQHHQHQDYFLFPRPGHSKSINNLINLDELYHITKEYKSNPTVFYLGEPAKLQIITSHQKWQLEIKGELVYGFSPLSYQWQLELNDIEKYRNSFRQLIVDIPKNEEIAVFDWETVCVYPLLIEKLHLMDSQLIHIVRKLETISKIDQKLKTILDLVQIQNPEPSVALLPIKSIQPPVNLEKPLKLPFNLPKKLDEIQINLFPDWKDISGKHFPGYREITKGNETINKLIIIFVSMVVISFSVNGIKYLLNRQDTISTFIASSKPELNDTSATQFLEKWLNAKKTIFAPPYDLNQIDIMTTGKLKADLLSSNGSLQWLIDNNAYYRYNIQRINKIVSLTIKENKATLVADIYEEGTLYLNDRVIEKDSYARNLRNKYDLLFVDAEWKIADYEVLN